MPEMSLILHIQSVLENAHIGISASGKMLAGEENRETRDHAAFIQPAIQRLVQKIGIDIRELNAVSAVHGPGSYTGIRVGLSAAKGLCFALGIPLLTVNTLEWMAQAGLPIAQNLICPMIDARRMEVFTAVYQKNGQEWRAPAAEILEKEFLAEELSRGQILFFGGGAAKFKAITTHINAVFEPLEAGHTELANLSWNLYQQRVFTDLNEGVPAYGKAFHSPALKP
jgi:tRNA threonylcarbamoyladenosine biosynthesis protein TsaB